MGSKYPLPDASLEAGGSPPPGKASTKSLQVKDYTKKHLYGT